MRFVREQGLIGAVCKLLHLIVRRGMRSVDRIRNIQIRLYPGLLIKILQAGGQGCLISNPVQFVCIITCFRNCPFRQRFALHSGSCYLPERVCIIIVALAW